jgi:hypothetical protein
MRKADWNNTTVLGGNLAEEITKLKSEIDGQIGVGGSATLVRWLLGRAAPRRTAPAGLPAHPGR